MGCEYHENGRPAGVLCTCEGSQGGAIVRLLEATMVPPHPERRLTHLLERLEAAGTDAEKLCLWEQVDKVWQVIRTRATVAEMEAFHDCLEQLVDVRPQQ